MNERRKLYDYRTNQDIVVDAIGGAVIGIGAIAGAKIPYKKIQETANSLIGKTIKYFKDGTEYTGKVTLRMAENSGNVIPLNKVI